uniref:Uncharacterized protein n=1 Tax=Rhizophora mucronata TaxID=61149 RepID=A0A2P2KRZ2_RHIMU
MHIGSTLPHTVGFHNVGFHSTNGICAGLPSLSINSNVVGFGSFQASNSQCKSTNTINELSALMYHKYVTPQLEVFDANHGNNLLPPAKGRRLRTYDLSQIRKSMRTPIGTLT